MTELDKKSKERAYFLYDYLDTFEVGTTKSLLDIHKYLFDGLYPYAGKIRKETISKDGFTFANGDYLETTLKSVQAMKEDTLEDIINKYIEMNIAHPFLEGNGRATRIWLDLILKKRLCLCVDWASISKDEYMRAIRESVTSPIPLIDLLKKHLSSKITDREFYKKGIDQSYYFEE